MLTAMTLGAIRAVALAFGGLLAVGAAIGFDSGHLVQALIAAALSALVLRWVFVWPGWHRE